MASDIASGILAAEKVYLAAKKEISIFVKLPGNEDLIPLYDVAISNPPPRSKTPYMKSDFSIIATQLHSLHTICQKDFRTKTGLSKVVEKLEGADRQLFAPIVNGKGLTLENGDLMTSANMPLFLGVDAEEINFAHTGTPDTYGHDIPIPAYDGP